MTNLPSVVTFQDTELTIVDHDGRPWLTAADLSRALGYKAADAVGRIYRRNKDEFTDDMTQTVKLTVSSEINGLKKETRIFSPRGCHLIAMFARTDRAKAFRKWVLDVLEAYTTQQQPADTLLPSEQQTLQEIAKAKVKDLPAELKGKALAEIWSRVHRKFRVAKYDQLRRDQLADVILYLNRMQLKTQALKREGLKLLETPELDELGPKTRVAIYEEATDMAKRSYQNAVKALEDYARQWPGASDAEIAAKVRERGMAEDEFVILRRQTVYSITGAIAALDPFMKHILTSIQRLEQETGLPWYGTSKVKPH